MTLRRSAKMSAASKNEPNLPITLPKDKLKIVKCGFGS